MLGIIALQQANLEPYLSPGESRSEGFVTVVHSLAQLEKMNNTEQHVICKDGDTVVAYMLAMTKHARNDIPVLVPMFEIFDKIMYHTKVISDYNFIVVGQVCVDKGYRGKGVFDHCYEEYRRRMAPRYDFAITEISSRNVRSLQAHKRVGFIEIHRYTDPKEDWHVVLWPWEPGKRN
ncbi:MAG TPA: GNAT family N-acetyltransferase [Chryseosolibacter sp.]|nr:GNAT family N-acetyltransferase [Chryseosolibacter sp.]